MFDTCVLPRSAFLASAAGWPRVLLDAFGVTRRSVHNWLCRYEPDAACKIDDMRFTPLPRTEVGAECLARSRGFLERDRSLLG
jgi:hypothetical protein